MSIRTGSEQKLLDAADELFFTRGIAATPIDAVLARAGVSAATMYRGYASKEALVAAALRRRHRDWLEVWDAAVERSATPEGRLLAVFDALDDFRSRPDGARWCAFLGSAAEYADPPAELADAVALDTSTLRDRLRDLAEPVAGSGARALADELLLVVSGDLAMRLRDAGDGAATTVARTVAGVLVRERTDVSGPTNRAGREGSEPGGR
jgi:AcrR family transcriptional regulator